ncbi:hypothetical protein GCM10011519_28220 [Marmoricola endophyticus]|uniref:Cyclic nucleotide-binding domain-containing protein n=1 Tax=Marmoricola endophyticus TaxID=2040280 RepID=A0A917BQE1_9ACTN|nr:cyclic nucleotide-binding domain-containing protein [Marmoricola endophyticus]GGF52620.1 hypothetical protein GCM10011519_28220 [Marmoricola endophyticus]
MARDDGLDAGAVPGVAALDPDAVQRLIDLGRLVHIPVGWSPIRADEPADKAYLLLEGSVEAVDGDVVLAELGAGEFVGEMGLVGKTLRSARVTVVQPVLAIAWPRADFQRLREEIPDFDRLVTETTDRRREENQAR